MQATQATVTIDGQEHPLKHAGQTGPRQHDTWMPGDVEHQGDITVVCLKTLPKSAVACTTRQVVEGETQGSRHIFEGGKLYDADLAEIAALIKQATGRDVRPMYLGRLSQGSGTLTHPEHRHQQFPDCVNAYVVQRSLDAEEQEARAQD